MQKRGEPHLIKIAVLENFIEADLVSSILSQRDIPHRLRSYHDTAYDGLFQMQKGWGELHAPRSLQQDILDIIEDIRTDNFFSDNHNG